MVSRRQATNNGIYFKRQIQIKMNLPFIFFANLGHSCDSLKKHRISVEFTVFKDKTPDGKLTSCRKFQQIHALRLAFHRRMNIAVQCRFYRTMP